MRSTSLLMLALLTVAYPTSVDAGFTLGTAGNFAILAGTTVTNTGPSSIDGGDVGVSPGTAWTGFLPGTLIPPFSIHGADAITLQAQNDLATAYNAAASLSPTQILTGQDLGGLTLLPGVYFFATTAQLTGTLTLDDRGDPGALFVFQIGSTFTTADNSSILSAHGGVMSGGNVFWQVGSSATLGTGTAFQGHILAMSSITLNTGATILDGSALARNGAVTLDTNRIVNGVNSVPEPSTMVLSLIGGTLLFIPKFFRKNSANGAPRRHSTPLTTLERMWAAPPFMVQE